jgi:hypothetical protein
MNVLSWLPSFVGSQPLPQASSAPQTQLESEQTARGLRSATTINSIGPDWSPFQRRVAKIGFVPDLYFDELLRGDVSCVVETDLTDF